MNPSSIFHPIAAFSDILNEACPASVRTLGDHVQVIAVSLEINPPGEFSVRFYALNIIRAKSAIFGFYNSFYTKYCYLFGLDLCGHHVSAFLR
jgi:hypothetical protein